MNKNNKWLFIVYITESSHEGTFLGGDGRHGHGLVCVCWCGLARETGRFRGWIITARRAAPASPLSGTLVWWDDGQCLRIMAKSVVLTALPSPDLPAIGRPRPPTPPLCARRAAVALIGVPARGPPGLRSPVAPQVGWGGASLAQSAAPGLALCAQRLGRIRPGGGGIRHPTRPPPRQRPNVVYLGGD